MSHANPPACHLYLVSPLDVGGTFPARLERALAAAPVAAFQYRVKGLDQHEAARLAEPLQAICAARDVAFIVNDSIALAKRLGADGVHLGQGDGEVREAREVLGREAQIGVTCHASRHLAMEAEWWSGLFEIPCVAIGGITPGNCAPLVRAGADFLAVSGAVWGGDEAAAVRAFHEAIAAASA